MKLTDALLRNAKPGPKLVKLFDGGGLYLHLAPSGGKWWRLKYRHEGKEKLLSLGVYPAVGLKEARLKAATARELLAQGTDPSAARQEAKSQEKAEAENRFEAVARAWLEHRAGAWTEGTRATILSSLVRDAFPALGARPVAEIRPAEVRELVKAVEARGAGETASRLFQRLRAIFRYAVAHDLAEVDPTYPLKPGEIFKPRTVQHRAAMPAAELPAFLAKLHAYEGEPATLAALRLLMLTAARPGEVRGARWKEFDLPGALWRIPAERMKMKTEHLVPLSRQALQVLEALQPITSGGELVFPSPYYPGKPISENTLNSALSRMGYKGAHTAHGFRALFSTCANEAGWHPDRIERQLAHEERNQSRGAYNRAKYLQERAELLQWWADFIEGRHGGKVLPLQRMASV